MGRAVNPLRKRFGGSNPSLPTRCGNSSVGRAAAFQAVCRGFESRFPLDSDVTVDAHVIAASVPLAEMFGYSTTLRSMSQGRAVYTMEFSHYEEVPKSKADDIISKVKG